ncbi:hypothetical protein HMPREF1624_07162 [Sporothrix schenckii ATCC 58251]|uniref:Peptidase A1 domain-containing protein n=1 Tax=Sporothrix schenckii (strain ATCC 58251 / de Perez 2211183) TaxID=1391915 RepID=U7PKS4_SPOS1|nr:hypothetical protein HMPREF1624_07162 [Sporothrix schenckii ATCC 58251]
MLGSAALLPLILWITTVHAFFPWFPPSVCADDNELCKAQLSSTVVKDATANDARRSLPAKAADSLTFKIGRRAAAHRRIERHEPLKARVERVAHRLARKYAPAAEQALEARTPATATATTTTASDDNADFAAVKRANNFDVVTATAPSASNAVGIDQDGTDFSYFIKAEFGSAQTPLWMLLDTGAGTTWVMGSDCKTPACALHNEFGAADSKTLQTSSKTFSIAYGSGTVVGNLASDTVTITPALSLTMSFGIANTTSGDFTHFPFDGILGLSLSEGATDNFWKTVLAAKTLTANVFGVALWREVDGGTNNGEIIFGATNPDKYTGSLSYTPVSSSGGGDWAIPMDDVGYNGGKAGITGRLAYIDTGTTYVFGPADDVAALHKQIPGASSSDGGVTYTVPCTSNQPLTVYFSGVAYSISSKDWMAAASDSSGRCTSNIYGHAVVANAWLLGDLFIKNVYAVFDIDQSRIGFATQAINAPASMVASSGSTASQTAPSPSGSGSGSSSGNTSGGSSSGGGSASGVASSAPATTTSPSGGGSGNSASLPGLSGHETAGTAVAESSGAPAPKSTAVTSPADQLESGGVYVSVVCIVAAIAMAV